MSTPNFSNLTSLINQPAYVAYRELLLAHPWIELGYICHYSSPPTLQERTSIGEVEQNLIRLGLEIRKSTKIPFWHALFAACLSREQCTTNILKGAFFHSGPGEVLSFDRAALEAGVLEKSSNNEQSNVGLSSKLFDSKGNEKHLNLIDFHCDVSRSITAIVFEVCRELLPQGFLLLNSGDSYHAVGAFPVTSAQRIQTLGKALMTCPIVDALYIGHQLQQDSSSLRISKGGKAKSLPIVIAAWAPS